jgi:gliding motility-associated-like protein
MKPFSLPYIFIGLIITLCSNYSYAQSPTLQASKNPTTCNGFEGSLTFGALTANASYQVSYNDDGVTVGPVTLVANGAGEISITGLNKGQYTGFIFTTGSTTLTYGGVVLSDPILPFPTFNSFPSICEGEPPPVLPTTSNNGYPGTWSPSVVNNQQSGMYTFTPAAGTCALPVNISITVRPKTEPTFSFGKGLTLCGTGPVPILTNTSQEGIPGTWSPAVVDPSHSGTYIFTPSITGCIRGTSFTLIVDPIIPPAFPFINSTTFCAGNAVPALPNTSSNGITGTWSPAVVSNTTSGTYTFTPDAGQCSIPVIYSVTVYPIITPAFSFNTAVSICSGATAPVLPATSNNGITGTWTPAVVSNTTSGTYTFNSISNPCAPSVTVTVTVNPVITPTFSFGSTTICEGYAVPALPVTSSNGITGTWSPAVVSNTATGTYTFTATSDPCAPPVTFIVTVNPVITPTFPFATASICEGDVAPVLPTTSLNGVTGTWSPAVVSNTASGTYTFTSTSTPCVPPVKFTVTVNPIIKPAFSFGTLQSVCINTTPPVLPAISNNGVTGTWSPAVVDNQTTATYTFTPAAGQCATTTTFNYEVNPIPSVVNSRKDTTVYDGAVLPSYDFPVNIPVTGIRWTNSEPSIGLPQSGSGTVPSFTATNMTDDPITAVITATPYVNGCNGASQSYRITVLPLDKDVFVPNVFSPNNDGKNDQLFVYSNYIAHMELHIFNQWGQRMVTLTDQKQGWDGKFRGSPQPVGVYVFVLKVITTDGRTVNKKGSITLVR